MRVMRSAMLYSLELLRKSRGVNNATTNNTTKIIDPSIDNPPLPPFIA
jgi:hypothetical protein